jgi:uncharacterized membrane protein (DUF106 family)
MNFSLSDIAPYLLVAIILLINLALWGSLRSKSTRDQLDILRAAKSLQKPWEKEDRAMQELSEKVKKLNADREDIQKDIKN